MQNKSKNKQHNHVRFHELSHPQNNPKFPPQHEHKEAVYHSLSSLSFLQNKLLYQVCCFLNRGDVLRVVFINTDVKLLLQTHHNLHLKPKIAGKNIQLWCLLKRRGYDSGEPEYRVQWVCTKGRELGLWSEARIVGKCQLLLHNVYHFVYRLRLGLESTFISHKNHVKFAT